MKTALLPICLLICFLIPMTGFTETNLGNGGHAVDCNDPDLVLLDYFHAKLQKVGQALPSELIPIEKLSRDAVLNHFRKRLAPYLIAGQFEEALASIGRVENWYKTKLKFVPDSGEPYPLPPGCELVQVAIRQGNAVFVDPGKLERLNPGQWGILEAHEALYKIAAEHEQMTSQNVRELMRLLLLKEISPLDTMRAAIASAGGNDDIAVLHHMGNMDNSLFDAARYINRSGGFPAYVYFNWGSEFKKRRNGKFYTNVRFYDDRNVNKAGFLTGAWEDDQFQILTPVFPKGIRKWPYWSKSQRFVYDATKDSFSYQEQNGAGEWKELANLSRDKE